ncbi:hypothetical protein JL720_1385 [Aureococcus anophagefferens]|nr:hypothetical protein JL720_1385 [Aureococcus anophagefferens]
MLGPGETGDTPVAELKRKSEEHKAEAARLEQRVLFAQERHGEADDEEAPPPQTGDDSGASAGGDSSSSSPLTPGPPGRGAVVVTLAEAFPDTFGFGEAFKEFEGCAVGGDGYYRRASERELGRLTQRPLYDLLRLLRPHRNQDLKCDIIEELVRYGTPAHVSVDADGDLFYDRAPVPPVKRVNLRFAGMIRFGSGFEAFDGKRNPFTDEPFARATYDELMKWWHTNYCNPPEAVMCFVCKCMTKKRVFEHWQIANSDGSVTYYHRSLTCCPTCNIVTVCIVDKLELPAQDIAEARARARARADARAVAAFCYPGYTPPS